MHVNGNPITSWRGDQTRWPESSLEQGDVRISGAVFSSGVSWHVALDRLGWTTIALVGRPPHATLTASVDHVVRRSADRCAPPRETARALAEHLRGASHDVEIGVLRVGPQGVLVELFNLSLPTIVHWDPQDGTCPYEPVAAGRHWFADNRNEILRLRPGALLLAPTGGILPPDAGWCELNGLMDALCVGMFGGDLGDVPPRDLADLLGRSWVRRSGPAGLVAIGLPGLRAAVA